MRFYLSTFGGLGDSLMLSMPAKRLKQLFPDCEIIASVRKDTVDVLKNNPDIDDVKFHKSFNDIPFITKKYDVVIEFRYGVKTFYINDKVDFDISAKEILERQRKTELDFWVADMEWYRGKKWIESLDKFYQEDPYRLGREKLNWYFITSYLSGIRYSPEDLFIHQEKVDNLSSDFIAISSPPTFKFSKRWPEQYWNKLFSSFPNENFLLLGIKKNALLKGDNVFHYEGKFNIYQTAYTISKSKFLISEEGGLVHIAKAVKTKSIVLFGPTLKWFFGYKDNINLRSDYPDCPFCHNQLPFWNRRCVKNKSPYCIALEMLEPDVVIDKVRQLSYRKEKI